MVIPLLFYFILLSAMLSGFMVYFRPRILSIIIGGSIVALAAMLTETYILNVTSDIFLLLFAAPAIEEVLKFGGTAYGKSFGNAVGVGLGFAVVENAFYFLTISQLFSFNIALMYIIARAIGDPLLHSSATSLSVKTWEGSRSALPKAIWLHMAYNLWAVALMGIGSLFRFEPVIIVLLLVLLLYQSRNAKSGRRNPQAMPAALPEGGK